MNWLREHKTTALIGGATALVVVGILAFGVFGVQTLFIDDKVSEANPFEDEPDGASTTPTTTPDVAEATQPETTEPVVTTVASGQFESRDHPSSGLATVITDGEQTFLRFEDDFATDNGPDLNVYLSKAPITSDSGAFDDDFVDLGPLKGNIGSQNYELDGSIDVSEYQTVVVWCVRFGVAFGAAPLTPA
jgi:hypothetical protein